MKKDCYISSVKLIDTSVYSYIIVNEDQKICESKVGEFHVSKPNKACMYATDLITRNLDHRNDDLTFHFDTAESLDYVNQMREVKTSTDTILLKNEYMDLTRQLLKEFVNKYNNRLGPLVDQILTERKKYEY